MPSILPTDYDMEQKRQIIVQTVTARGTCPYMAVFRTKPFKSQMTLRMNMYILYNQRDATYTMFKLDVSFYFHVLYNVLYYYQRSTCFGRLFSAHHQELIKLYVQPWVLSCFPAVYCTTGRQQESMTIPKAAHTFL